ncbi:MAG: SURF1 family protein, partial [Pseudomonadota bacterium]
MIERFRQAGLVLPGVLSLLALGILVSLGNWQWQRLQWKEGLIAKLEDTARAEPVPLSMLGASENSDVLRFRRVRVTGTFLHDREMHVWSPGSEGPGWAVFTALRVTESVPAFQATGDGGNVSD